MHLLKSWQFWFGFVFSLLCLWLALRKVPLAELVNLMAAARPVWLLLAIASLFLSVVARAWRWVVLLGREKQFHDSLWAQGVGFLFTNVFPLRMGEPARVLVMAERCKLPFMQVGASAIAERLLDAATNVCLLILVLPWMAVPTLMSRAGMSFGALALTGLAILLLVARFDRHSERLLQSVCARFPLLPAEKIVARWSDLVNGFQPLTRGRIALRAISWSLVSWAFSIAVNWCALRTFQPDGRLVEAAFMTVALSFAVAVPSSPGFIGVFQLAGQQALVQPFGAKYDPATALAITLTAHLVYYVLTTALGVIGLWRLGKSFMNFGRAIAVGRPARKAPLPEVVS